MTVESQKKNIKHFIRDGFWASICEGFAENNFNIFSGLLSATSGDLSILASSQNISNCCLQLWSEKLTSISGSRKRLVLICVSLQAITLGFMATYTINGKSASVFMALSLVFCILGSFSGSIWGSWISDLLPPYRRGYCFGIRNKFSYPTQFLAMILGGYLLQAIPNKSGSHQSGQLAFCLVFLIGLIAKLFSLYHLFSQPEMPFSLPEKSIGPTQLLRYGLNDRFNRRIIVFFSIFGFAINLSGPFLTPYLLDTLKFSYIHFAAITAIPIVSRFFSGPMIGRIVDKNGYKKTFITSVLLMPLITLGWSLSTSFYVILIAQFISGFVWTAFELAVFCLLAENSKPENRQRLQSLKHLSWNLFSSFGALAGGFMIYLYQSPMILFWTSTLARVISGVLALLLFTASE